MRAAIALSIAGLRRSPGRTAVRTLVLAASATARQPGILQASATATAPFAGVTHAAGGASTSAGSGALLAVPPDYEAHIRTYRMLQGSLAPRAIVLDQQLAA